MLRKYANPTTPENLRKMQPELTAGAGLILPGESLDAICYSCTSASVVIGDETIEAAIRAPWRRFHPSAWRTGPVSINTATQRRNLGDARGLGCRNWRGCQPAGVWTADDDGLRGAHVALQRQ